MIFDSWKNIYQDLDDEKSLKLLRKFRQETGSKSEIYQRMYLIMFSVERLLKPIKDEYLKRMKKAERVSKEEGANEEIIKQVKETVKREVLLNYKRMRGLGIDDNEILNAVYDVYISKKQSTLPSEIRVNIQYIAQKLIEEFRNIDQTETSKNEPTEIQPLKVTAK